MGTVGNTLSSDAMDAHFQHGGLDKENISGIIVSFNPFFLTPEIPVLSFENSQQKTRAFRMAPIW